MVSQGDGSDVVHHHFLSLGMRGHAVTHTHPGGGLAHDGQHPEHREHERGAYWSHPGPGPGPTPTTADIWCCPGCGNSVGFWRYRYPVETTKQHKQTKWATAAEHEVRHGHWRCGACVHLAARTRDLEQTPAEGPAE